MRNLLVTQLSRLQKSDWEHVIPSVSEESRSEIKGNTRFISVYRKRAKKKALTTETTESTQKSLKLEFENAEASVGGLSGDGDVELILTLGKLSSGERDCALAFQCDSVHSKYQELSALGLSFVHPPMNVVWGFGAELRDSDGYAVRLWDKTTMPGYKEK